ncbi:DUF4188 domain-containing protein [Streptomyces sp. TP-A0874]|uniref:DUF4188 domain-containing protein n=1 Tax=Streptomyces sp. TP-A0874 TaxID=549819 RepID=UPI000853B1A4|nr:DUF4188 domain-containing protein [Streptomyces sp. TP-A0874]
MSAKPIPGRTTAAAAGEVVVFLVGMRINRFWAVHRWLPVLRAMPPMLKELSRDEDSGLLGYQLLIGSPRTIYVVQYWESKEKLLDYAADPGKLHRPAWGMLNRFRRQGGAHVGFWHETYLVPAGRHESIYVDMPAHGLGKAVGVLPVGHGVRAADRLGA